MATNREKVLVVDDDDASRRLLEVRLRGLGFQVATADNGESALASVQDGLPALILLDLQMPVMDGMEPSTLRSESCSAKHCPKPVATGLPRRGHSDYTKSIPSG